MNEQRLLNVYEVARYLGVSIKTVYRLVSRGELEAVSVGSSLAVQAGGCGAVREGRKREVGTGQPVEGGSRLPHLLFTR